MSVYDAECPRSREDEFFLSVVNETPAAKVLDLGCKYRRPALSERGGSPLLAANAGFNLDQIYGGWNRESVGAGDGEFLVIARA